MTRVSIALLASGLPFSHGGSSGRSAGGCVGGTTVDCDPVGASTYPSVDSRDTAGSVGGDCADVVFASCERATSLAASSLVATAGTSVAPAGTSVATAVTDVGS